ncbi:two-component regulator propeller domain-containing protein [Spirosoma sp. SC4-14]|uniref:hybrid sensor histidine kinase/response regulator transcription factor n=1 Tax=Spirosoma sp. SC4-14 TaxID=3128900 RepID=UPI0030CAC2C9
MRTYLFLFLIVGMQGKAQSRLEKAAAGQSADQPRNTFEHLSVKDGLSNNSVNCILQDREGFMWFGTNDGLNKYDGYAFTALKPDPGNPMHSFRNNQISGFCEGNNNHLWVATLGGLHDVDKRTGQVTPHMIRARNADRWNYQHSVYEDSQQVLWISTLGGLARYEPQHHQFTLYPVPQPEATIKTVFEDPQHRLWVATYQGLYLFDRETGRFTLVPALVPTGASQPTFIAFYLDKQQVLWLATATAGYGLFRLDLRRSPWHLEPYNPNRQINPFTFLNSVHGDAQGILWLATTTGLQRIDPASNLVYTYRPDPDALKSISSNTAQTVYHDRAGTLWVGTDNGIDRQAVNNKPFMTYQVLPNKGTANLTENKVVALLPDNKGRFWISNGYSVYRPVVGSNHLQAIPPETLGSAGSFKNYTQALTSDGSGGVWLGTTTGLYHFNQITGQFTNYPSEVPVEYISRTTTGNICIAGYVPPSSGIAVFNPYSHRYQYNKYRPNDPNGIPDQYIHGLLISRKGDMWVPFRKQGIGLLKAGQRRFVQYTAGVKSGLTSNDIQTVYEDAAGTIWVGTNQGGVNRYDARTDRFSAITTRNGLASNNIAAIIGDNSGHIWISTDNGLSRYNPHTHAIRNYQTTSGLPSNDFIRNAVYKQKERLYFGSLNGVVYFNPDSIRDDTRPFPVYITSLKVLDQSRILTDSVIALNYDENFLSLSFSALSYTYPEQNQYAYQLIGVDKNWVQNGSRHVANYTNLSPGYYTFRVKASNSDGIWNEKGTAIQLIIYPPWWATWWAYCIYTILAAGAIWAYMRFYTNRIRQQQELELNRREAEQLKTVDELKTRFFSNITHEFRTPLSLIISPIEKLLNDSRFDWSTRQTLALIQRNADHLLRLINQLLDLSKLEANQMTVVQMRGNIAEFVGHLLASFRPSAEQKNVLLLYSAVGPETELLFDADKWEKILANLLSNALKFTKSGGHVTVTLKPDSTQTTEEISHIEIQIEDSGIGISPEYLPHIFDRFYQIDTSRTRAYEGTGIGLALVKELIDLIGGTIYAESQPGVGTTFRLKLPVWPVTANGQAPRLPLPEKEPIRLEPSSSFSPDVAGQEFSRGLLPIVLIVEDNRELGEFLARELMASYRVLLATDGQEGWQMAQTELPDIVISDVMMPQMDGYELTHRIKNHAATDHIAVVILTAKAAHSSRIEGLQEGADDYLAKPFHLDELHLRLRNLISHQQKLRDQYRQQFAQPDMPSPLNVVEDAFLQGVYQLLETNLQDPSLSVDWLADQVAMSRKTLYRKIHSLTQLSPHDLIRQYRLRKAADLLRAGHNASQTAYQTGFKSPSYFTIVFKEFYGKTPTEFIETGFSKAE